jgi:hypothetical protein
MIMSNQAQKQSQQPAQPKKPAARPNEHGSIIVQAHMKIFDPQTKRVYVEGRA